MDPMYFVIVLPGIAIALWATWRVKSAYAHAGRIPSSRGLTGAQAAERLLSAEGIDDVQIETTPGTLSDHYDPRHRVLRLSHDVYHGRSLASLGIAAHEAGHAMQHTHGYKPLALRSLLVPTANIGSNGAYLVFILGMVMQAPMLLIAAIVLFSAVVLFQIVTLPVEFDASSRARRALLASGIVTEQEDREVARVLNAAAMTYVAAVITSALTLLYYLYRSGLLGGRR
jgi:Zn-dependent membrane protease YugP